MGRRFLILLLGVAMLCALLVPVATRAEQPRVPLMLVHGHGVTPDITWETAATWLEAKGYQEGVTLFVVDLSKTRSQDRPMGLLDDAGYLVEEMRAVLRRTGARRLDLVGHSRGGVLVRLLAAGDTGAMVRRAVSLNGPHEGVLAAQDLDVMLAALHLSEAQRKGILIPVDLVADSPALRTLTAREQRFADRPVSALAIGTTWREGVPAFLEGHDGAVPLVSQLAWPGARTRTVRLGPDAGELAHLPKSGLAAALLVWNSPHLQSHESEAVFSLYAAFLMSHRAVPTARACMPFCRDWHELREHPARAELEPWLAAGMLPYEVGTDGRRIFQPNRPMTRAEFMYGLTRGLGLSEQLRAPSFADTAGHWAVGYVEAAYDAGLITGADTPGLFEPDRPLTRGEAAALVSRVTGRLPAPVIAGDRELHTSAQGALMLVRAFMR